ncbi:MAG: septum formation initiator family protein [Rhodospirillales bacterium]|nr:septum formation initiator family protein [Rhodospirillales bacterium]
MSIGRAIKRKLRAVAMPAVFLAITGYFGWNATQGNRGLVAYAQREALLTQVQTEKAAAQAEKDSWERRVSGLRTMRLDADTLDERARAMLNLAEPSDVIVPYSQKEKLF